MRAIFRTLRSLNIARSLKTIVPATLIVAGSCLPIAAQTYKVSNIISDGSVPATTIDANFINPWGVSVSPNWWISAQGTGFNYVVPPTGTIAFKVIVPNSSGATTATGLPAGSVTTAGSTGMILPNGTKASFLFSTLDGTISGWNGKLGTANAISSMVINNTSAGAVYTGLALLNTPTNSYLLAANFGTGSSIEVYDSAFKSAKLAGTFTDPTLPAGYVPYSVHVIGSQVFVNYAVRTTAAPFRTVNTIGNGIVSVFDNTGVFVARVVTGGNLNAPWGIAFAPANFGVFSNALLVGNFGDGRINAYDPKTFSYLGQLLDSTGKSLSYASLWDLLPGGTTVTGTTAVSAGDTSTVYFTAGLAGEAHGLFAGISNGTVTGATPTFGVSTSSGAATVSVGSSTQTSISVAPTNGFSGPVALTCSGLPAGATCSFSPATLTVSPTASAIGTVTIQTAKETITQAALHRSSRWTPAITSALLLPFASLLAFRRRSKGILPIFGLLLVFTAATGLITGCNQSPDNVVNPGTPVGASTVVVTATSGSITQQTSFALTVQ